MLRVIVTALKSVLGPIGKIIANGFKWLLAGIQNFFKFLLDSIHQGILLTQELGNIESVRRKKRIQFIWTKLDTKFIIRMLHTIPITLNIG